MFSTWGRPALLSLAASAGCSIATVLTSQAVLVIPDWLDRHIPSLLLYGAGALLSHLFVHSALVELIFPRFAKHSADAGNFAPPAAGDGWSRANFAVVLASILFAHALSLACRRYGGGGGKRPGPGASSPPPALPPRRSALARVLLKLGHEPAALLNVCTDALHNYADGLALCTTAVAAARGEAAGLLAAFVATAAHEVAQEVSDIAVLRHSGLSRGEAFAVNSVISLSVFAGWAGFWLLAMLTRNSALISTAMTSRIEAFVGGHFLYLAGVEMIPGAISLATLRERRNGLGGAKHPALKLSFWRPFVLGAATIFILMLVTH